MELRAFAERVLQATTVAGKLDPPAGPLTDGDPGPALRVAAPVRPPELPIRSSREVRVPPVDGYRDPAQRARILHALANHELQAAELFAWALLAFPAAPPPFRRGLCAILADEQRHCRLYVDRIEALGARFGDFGVTGHFWSKLCADVHAPLDFVCLMGLTFENANLDFAAEYAAAARAAGDPDTAAVLARVHADEIEHVGFAWHWLAELAPGADPWQLWVDTLRWPLGPGRARGRSFDRAAREAAGMTPAFIDRLAAAQPKRPSGRPR
ncbi:MAG TPA: DUF455 family protein [Kofleriaceae bacterium]|nr:DUF455 family protein [Kofleriaceae bacterium]